MACRVGEATIAVEIVGRERLLEPVQLVLLDAPEELERLFDGVRPSAVEHQAALRAERLARRADECLVVGEVTAERPPTELERRVAVADDALRDAAHLVGRLGHHLARVDGNIGDPSAAEQCAHGPPDALPAISHSAMSIALIV